MGIGNTTSAAAVLSGLTGQAAALTAGRGTGVTDEVMAHKREVIDRAIRTHNLLERRDARETLRCVGGLEIAAIAGAALAAAQRRLVVIADGFISTTAIACAAAMAQTSGAVSSLRDALFFAHRSAEQGHEFAIGTCAALLHTDGRPLLDLRLRLGEGSGAALATPVLRAAAAVMREMATFGSAGISAGEHAGAHRDVSGQ
jgi:nicotinate-nucleotide--dimethylbenzimidazole phosphoribosyltransferase